MCDKRLIPQDAPSIARQCGAGGSMGRGGSPVSLTPTRQPGRDAPRLIKNKSATRRGSDGGGGRRHCHGHGVLGLPRRHPGAGCHARRWGGDVGQRGGSRWRHWSCLGTQDGDVCVCVFMRVHACGRAPPSACALGHFTVAGTAAPCALALGGDSASLAGHGDGRAAPCRMAVEWEEEEPSQRKPHPSSSSHPSSILSPGLSGILLIQPSLRWDPWGRRTEGPHHGDTVLPWALLSAPSHPQPPQ